MTEPYELTDEEITNLLRIVNKDWEVNPFDRAIANAASDKAYAQGQKDLAKELMAKVEQHSTLSSYLFPHTFASWLRQKGLLE